MDKNTVGLSDAEAQHEENPKYVYFTSDIHLGSGYHKEPREVERRLVRWLEEIRPRARAIYFLGDVFDYWFEYKNVVPRGYVRFLGKLGELSDEGVELHFFAGNHDVWFADYLQTELGACIHHYAEVIEIDGFRFRLAHGDEEYRRVSWVNDVLYQVFRCRLARWLFAGIHPRWTVGFAMAWSLHSRKQGIKKQTLGKIPHAYHNEYFDVEQEHLVKVTKEYIELYPEIDYYLYGHRHIMLDMSMRGGKRMVILGDWLRYNSYAEWDGTCLSLYQYEVEDEERY